MIAAEKREHALGRNLGFEQARVTALLIDVIRISNDLARTSHSHQSAIPVTYWAVHVNVAAQDAGEHTVGVAFAERQRAFLEGDRDVAVDQFVDQVHRQIQAAQPGPKNCEGLFMLATQVGPHLVSCSLDCSN